MSGVSSKKSFLSLIKGSLYDQEWHYRVAPIRENKIIIVFEYVSKKSSKNLTSRKFASFSSYEDVYSFVYSSNNTYRTFYELIKGEELSKMRYDVDFIAFTLEEYNFERKEVLYELISSLSKLTSSPFVIYSSCNYPKISYHVIVLNIVGYSYQLQNFYNCTLLNMNKKYAKMIDVSIYKKLQNFRILSCTKAGKLRYKKILSKFEYKDINYSFIRADSFKVFLDSLSSYTTGEEEKLTYSPPPKKSYDNNISVEEDQIMKLISTLGEFSIKENRGTLLILKRHASSYCSICDREHEKENPYAYVNSQGEVYFDCRRDIAQRKLYVGNVNFSFNEETEIINEEDFSIIKFEYNISDTLKSVLNI